MQPSEVEHTQNQSQAVRIEEVLDQFNQTDNKLAQRSSSITSEDILLGDHIYENKSTHVRDASISEDQEVMLGLNTEEQEQFEVLDSADGDDDDKSQGKSLIWVG